MGFAKQQMEHDYAVGYHDPGRLVCGRHFDSPYIVALLEANASDDPCDYCQRPGAADLDLVLDAMSTVLWTYYDRVGSQLGWEGEYQGYHCDVTDAVEHLFSGLATDDDLWTDLLDAWSPEELCKADAYGFTTDEELAFDWNQFVDETKTRTRYVFLAGLNDSSSDDDDSALPCPGVADGILGQVAALALDYELLTPLPAGSRWIRARTHSSSATLELPRGLCSPPTAVTVANRMSPAGISMFYGARDELTAIAETWQPGRRARVVTLGAFETLEDLVVLDLTRLPQPPEVFELSKKSRHEELSFLWSFVRDLSATVVKDGREHVDYVPTQIVTEYFRRIVRHHDLAVGGILYRSAKNPDGVCAVFFADHDECLPAGSRPFQHQLLRLDSESVTTRTDGGKRVAQLAQRLRRRRRRGV